MDDYEMFSLVRENYAKANSDYISEQIRIASSYMKVDSAESTAEKTDDGVVIVEVTEQ